VYGAFESKEEYDEFVKNGDWYLDSQAPDFMEKLLADIRKGE
tara:strand:- start:16954 stop:17079 length:126 start_codon:yes stop_codon:yes gene_type:complete